MDLLRRSLLKLFKYYLVDDERLSLVSQLSTYTQDDVATRL